MSAMMSAVAFRSVLAVSREPAYLDRSTGGPAAICTVLRGNRRGLLEPYGKTCWAPQCAIGTTGAPVVRESRAAPVLATIGHRPGSLVAVPSG